jgi:transposase-like protein
VDHRKKEPAFWIPNIDGIPFRKLGDENDLTGVQAYNRVFTELELLPKNLDITRQYCEYSSGILIIDGKYIKVRGYKQKIPFIYVIDYETHDILFGLLAEAEDKLSFLNVFQTLKALNYPIQIVVADDRSSLPLALKQVYPNIPVQLCLNHYLENIRQQLHIRTDPTHRHFFNVIKSCIFDEYDNDEKLTISLRQIWNEQCGKNPLRHEIILQINKRRQELFAYKKTLNCPSNTNLIELFNSHFNARLKGLKGFKTKAHAILWLNGMIIRRRTKPFTDCGLKFKHLNGKCSLQMSIKKQAKWPEILGIKAPEI